MTDEYCGIERRADTPTQVLMHVTQMLQEHTKDEMDRYQNILDKIDAHKDASDLRHEETQSRLSHLAQSIESFIEQSTDFHDAVKRAFPKDDEGKPDYDGHRGAHLAWMKDSTTAAERWEKVRTKVYEWGAVILLGWIAVSLWQEFLKGPK